MPYYYVGPILGLIQFTTQVPVSPVQLTPHTFHTMTLQNPNWNMDTGASSHLADNTGKHAKLPFYNSKSSVDSMFEIIHSDIWISPIPSENNIILTASSSSFLQRIITSLHSEFAMMDLGSLNYFLESKLGSDGDPVNDPTLYHSLARGLQYLTFPCSDLSYAVHQLHLSSTTQLSAYTDADWAGCPVTRRFTFGYCVFLGDNLLSCPAKRQVTLSRSSAEAEYRGVANVVAETDWICNLLCELHTPLYTATLVYCDNVSAVYMSSNLVQHQRTKHIEIDIYFVRDFVSSGLVRILHVPLRFQYADIFTKGLPTALFIEFCSSLNV
nr:ribonuclease H-like domain-containing protein [Tanacetum cinerariifolium]